MKYKVGIIDDDPLICDVVSSVLRSNFEDIEVYIYNEPVVSPTLDIYIIDNQFDGECYIKGLLKEIRSCNPNALVVAMSATLDFDVLRELMNSGCNAAWNKNWDQSEEILNIIKTYIHTLERAKTKQSKGMKGAFDSLTDLLTQWNERLKNDI